MDVDRTKGGITGSSYEIFVGSVEKGTTVDGTEMIIFDLGVYLHGGNGYQV